MSLPYSRMLPLLGSSKPASICRVVVLPHPEGPSSEKNSPAPTWRSTSSTATTLVVCEGNSLFTPISSIAASSPEAGGLVGTLGASPICPMCPTLRARRSGARYYDGFRSQRGDFADERIGIRRFRDPDATSPAHYSAHRRLAPDHDTIGCTSAAS